MGLTPVKKQEICEYRFGAAKIGVYAQMWKSREKKASRQRRTSAN